MPSGSTASFTPRDDSVPIELTASIDADGDELALAAEVEIDQRSLGMTHSPLGMTRAPSRIGLDGG